MTDTTVTLGDFTFGRYEVPEQIPFGGEQRLVVHELVGGTRVVDAMGPVTRPIEWSGIFVGSAALQRALYLDGLRKAGKPLALTWSELSFSVVVRALECDFVRSYRLPYRITCEVIADLSAPPPTTPPASADQQVNDDMAAEAALADTIADAVLIGHIATAAAALATAGPVASASPSALAAVVQPLAATRDQASALLVENDIALASVTTVGGIAPYASGPDQAAALSGQIAAFQRGTDLFMADRTAGRLALNLTTLEAGSASVMTGGGNLFALASQRYGDPMGWTAIAEANGLDDPVLSGIATLALPIAPVSPTGILDG